MPHALRPRMTPVVGVALVCAVAPARAELHVCTRGLATPGQPELVPQLTCAPAPQSERGVTVFVREVPPAEQLAAYQPYIAPIPGWAYHYADTLVHSQPVSFSRDYGSNRSYRSPHDGYRTHATHHRSRHDSERGHAHRRAGVDRHGYRGR
jgi:hypothetical protein